MSVRDCVIQCLMEKGIKEAVAISLTFKGGESITIHSDTHPALDRPAEDLSSEPEVRQSAEGG